MGIETNKDNAFLLVWDNFYIYYSIIDEENTIEVNSIYHQKEDIRR